MLYYLLNRNDCSFDELYANDDDHLFELIEMYIRNMLDRGEIYKVEEAELLVIGPKNEPNIYEVYISIVPPTAPQYEIELRYV